jgi:hypothetical protein
VALIHVCRAMSCALYVAVLFQARRLHALSSACSRVIRGLFARHRHSFAHSCRASGSHVSRVNHVCRAASARNNKLFSLINTHINDVNMSCHIF